MQRLSKDIPTRIETERLYLRPYQAGDGQWYYQMSQRNRPHLARYEADNAAMALPDPEAAEALARDFRAAWEAQEAFVLGAFLRDSDQFVAQVYVGVINEELPEFQIGYFADIDHQGHGYVSEAVQATLQFLYMVLNAHRVRLECDDTNERSVRVAERCGFVREGHLRETRAWPDGGKSGTLVYGLLKREWASESQESPSGSLSQGSALSHDDGNG